MNKTADRTVALDKGRVDVYTKNGVTLYAYQTHDLIDDEVFVLARSGRGVVIELPCFFDNLRELTDFLAREGAGLAELDAVVPCDSYSVACLMCEHCSLRDTRLDMMVDEARAKAANA